jgi:hypothetical protein
MREVHPLIGCMIRFVQKYLSPSSLQAFLLISLFSGCLLCLPIAHSTSNVLSPITHRSDVSSEKIVAESSNLAESRALNHLIAQSDDQSQSSNESWSDEDTSNLLTGLIVLLILPLFWGPTRKAVGLLNIIVGTILTFTGIGALFGIPMILVGGVCLFI